MLTERVEKAIIAKTSTQQRTRQMPRQLAPRPSHVNCVKSHNALVWAFVLQKFPQQRDQLSPIVSHSLWRTFNTFRGGTYKQRIPQAIRSPFQVFLHLSFHLCLRCLPLNLSLWPMPN